MMTTRAWIRQSFRVGLIASMTTLAFAGTAAADPPSNGCPTGFEGRTLEAWAADGYRGAPPRVDDPANGGNGDGIVCGRPLGEGTSKQTQSGMVLVQFRDNDLPASDG